jgi:PEGA domain
MTRGKFLVGAVTTALAIGVTPALAQRTSGGGESTGSAVSRGGGDSGGGASRGSGDSGSSSSSGSSSGSSPSSSSSSSGSASSGTSYSAPSSSSTTREYVSAPMRPSERSERAAAAAGRQREGRSGGGESTGARAVPRGEGGSSGASGSVTGRTAGESSSAPSSAGSSPSDRAVPAYSRPRDGRPQTGQAVERFTPRPPDGNNGYYRPSYPYYPYYGYGYGYGYNSYYWPGAFGLGFFYDPLWYDPFYYGGGGVGYYGGGYGNPYGGSQGGYGAGSYSRAGSGSVRLKIKPRDAQVYVDGYFVGTVDQFDGLFQKLTIDGGNHRIEIKSEGHEVTQFDVLITPGETVTYQGELKKIQ